MSKKGAGKKVAVKKSPSCTLDQLKGHGGLQLKLGEQALGLCVPRTFSSGSYGYGYSGPVTIDLGNGVYAECQASINITVKHSKPDAEGEAEAPKAEAA